MPEEPLTVKEAAARLGVSPQTVRRWIRRRLLSAVRDGERRWRIRADDMERRLAPSPAILEQRRAAIREILALREELKGRHIPLEDIIAESQRDLEARTNGIGGH